MESAYMKLGREMQLFLQHDASAGVVYWQPKGLKLYEKLKAFVRKIHDEADYQEVKSPSLVGESLFVQSGHMEKYKEYMFRFAPEGEIGYALRPMSCPNHIVLYQAARRSWRELPVAYFEFGEVYRNEASGALQALFRARSFCQDDSHVFVSADGVHQAARQYLAMAKKAYQLLGFKKMEFVIALRPAERFGDDALWDKAEDNLRQACQAEGLSWKEEAGGGAFYGPKIEIRVRDQRDREWQLGTLQADYILGERFGLQFSNDHNQLEQPVILHHAVLGSLERMIGILLENGVENLPSWLHPWQGVVVSVSAKSADYAKALYDMAGGKASGILLDDSDAPLSEKIAKWKSAHIPHIAVVGEKEAQKHASEGGWPMVDNQHKGRAAMSGGNWKELLLMEQKN